MFAAVPMLQMDMARKLDLSVKYLTSMAKDLSQFLSLLSLMAREKGFILQMFHDFLMQGWSRKTLDNLCCLGATTGKLGGNLAVREHGLAESSEAICNQEGNVVFC